MDAEALIDRGDASLNVALQPGDAIVVPHVKTFRVYVTGAVSKPGSVEFRSTEGITVLQAITAAGGPTERASLSKVSILRSNPDGSQEKIQLNLRKIQKGKQPDQPLRKNDSVVVGEWLF